MQDTNIGRVLVVDDEAELMAALCETLGEQGYQVRGVGSGQEALKILQEQDFDLLLTDLMMPEMDGIALLQAGLKLDPHLGGIVMTGQGTVPTAVAAMKIGAFDYVLKPFKVSAILPVLSRAMEVRRLRLENVQLRDTAAIYDLSLVITFTQDLDALLDKVADAALQQMQADEVSILLPTSAKDQLYVAVVRGEHREHILGQRLPADQGAVGWVAQEHKPLILHGGITDPRFMPLRPRADISTAVSLPMLVGGELVGVLNVSATRQRRPFALGQVKALNILASTAASALKSARLRVQLEESERRYRSIFENAVEGIFQATPDGRFTMANLAHARLLGYDSPQELLASIADIQRQVCADPERGTEFRRRLTEEGEVQGFEIPACRKDGRRIWVSLNARRVDGTDGAAEYFEGTAEDITQRREAEEALQAAQAYTQNIIDSSLDMIIAVDQERRIIEFNKAAQVTFGYRREEVLGKHVDLLYALPEESAQIHQTLLLQGRCVQEITNRRKDGRVFPALLSGSALRNVGGERVGFMGISRDITPAKRQEQQKRVLQQVREEVWKMGKEEDIENVLVAVREGLGRLEVPFGGCAINVVEVAAGVPVVRRHELSRQGEWRTIADDPAGTEKVARFWREGQTVYRPNLDQADPYQERQFLAWGFGSVRRSVVDVPFSHGTLAVNSEQPNAFSDENIGFLENLAGVLAEGFRRLDDLKALSASEQQFRQAQKLEALGRLAGGVAHDFNNLLTVVNGYSQLLLAGMDEQDERRENVEEIRSAGLRAESLVRQLLIFSRKQTAALEVLDLDEVVRGVEKMLRRVIGEDIELLVEPASGMERVKGDRGQMEQVLMNLAVNARDAMPQGGRLAIETAVVSVGTDAQGKSEVPLGRFVRLRVSDTGAGMDAAVREHIFEPFFTTKEPDKGTGLGLATVYEIVRQSGGHIQVASEPGEGTTFAVHFPCLDGEPSPSAGSAGIGEVPAGGTETVLVVEDHETVLGLAGRVLRGFGYAVLEARGGQEALRLGQEHPGPIHLLITDVIMPQMDGAELAKRLRAMRPEAQVLYMSGYTPQMMDDRNLRIAETEVLHKPFGPDDLARKVRQVLDRD